MRKSKMILICILTIIMLMFTTTNVFALLDGGDDVELDLNNLPEDPVDPGANEPNETYVNQVEEPGGKDQPTTGKNNTNGMPDTGLEDAPIIAIVICVVAASIGYTQIIKYNKY